MASKRRLRRRSCTGKIAHPTRVEALFHAFLLRRRNGGRIHAYRCTFGDHWHVGHSGRVWT